MADAYLITCGILAAMALPAAARMSWDDLEGECLAMRVAGCIIVCVIMSGLVAVFWPVILLALIALIIATARGHDIDDAM